MYSVSKEKTIQRRSESRRRKQDSIDVDGEDEVVTYLQDITETEETLDSITFNADIEYDTVGEVTEAEVIFDADDELRQRASLPTDDQLDVTHSMNRTFGKAFGADDDWMTQIPVIRIEFELPQGDTVDEVFKAPVWDTDSGLFNLCEAIGYVPGSGDTFVGSQIPLKDTNDGWKIVLPSRQHFKDESEDNQKEQHEGELIANTPDIVKAGFISTVLFMFFLVVSSSFAQVGFLGLIGFTAVPIVGYMAFKYYYE